MDDVQLTDKAARVARSMLAARHPTGEYLYLSIDQIVARVADLPKIAVGQIVARFRTYGWVEEFREQGGGGRLYRLTGDGAVAAREALAANHGAPPAAAHRGAPERFRSMAELARTESPETLAAIRRVMGWGDDNRAGEEQRGGETAGEEVHPAMIDTP